ncbi:MAG TPA: amidohydrolase family protein [Kofleriaceae bacterium]|nr:amidohydrolase family protein [Kofleriaceae bacterium]
MRRRKSRAEGPPLLPIKLDPVSNGEFEPRPPDPRIQAVQRLAHERAAEAARRLGQSRREFLRSSCGAATVLLALNELGCGGGRYDVPREAATEKAAADQALGGKELIFDVQTHHVSGDRRWWEADVPTLADFLRHTPKAKCGEPEWVGCFTRDPFVKDVFMDSDTRMGVLSALWGSPDINAIHVEEAALTRERMAMMKGAPRLRIHGTVLPILYSTAQIREQMQELAEKWDIAAWKLYPVWGPKKTGYRVDREPGAPVIERAIELGRPLIAIHKGLPLAGMDPEFTRSHDIGPAARMFPRATFLIYHSGWEADHAEGPYDPKSGRGVDALIRSLEQNGIGRDGNVYAELGSIWRGVMGDPQQAAHVMGKLLRYLGEDRILWGTDCIWYGSPQDQIQALRSFEITPEFQERFGYPALTREAKAKIFGKNAIRVYGIDEDEVRKATEWDPAAQAKAIYQEDPRPSHETRGPRTRREYAALLRANRGLP